MKKLSLLLLSMLAVALALPSHAARNTSGTYSLPAGNPVVSGTTITSTWANSTLSDLKTEMTNSLSRDGYGAMRAPLKVPVGSAAAPSLTWSSDAASGLYLSAASDVRMSVASTDIQTWTPTTTALSNALTVAKGATVTNSTSNGAGTTTTGNGTGAGLVSTGGATGAGVTGSGGATSGVGVLGTGTGASAGVTGTGGATNGVGVAGTGTGTGAGVTGAGGSSGASASTGVGVLGTGGGTGPGVRALGGSGGGDGIVAIGSGATGRGVNALGGTGQAGGLFTAGTAATSGTPQSAIRAAAGYLSFESTTSPSSSTAITNTLTPANIVKSHAKIVTNGAGSVSVSGGLNVTASISTGNVLVTFPTGGSMANSDYTVVISDGGPKYGYYVSSQTASAFAISVLELAYDGANFSTTSASFATHATTLHMIVVGPQ